MRVCLSVGPLVHWSIGPSIGWFVVCCMFFFQTTKALEYLRYVPLTANNLKITCEQTAIYLQKIWLISLCNSILSIPFFWTNRCSNKLVTTEYWLQFPGIFPAKICYQIKFYFLQRKMSYLQPPPIWKFQTHSTVLPVLILIGSFFITKTKVCN